MKTIERIDERLKGGSIKAVIIRGDYNTEGINFASLAEDEMQLGVMVYKAGHVIKAHFHNQVRRTIYHTSECLHLDYGKVLVEFYDNDDKKVMDVLLNGGDTVCLLEGSHGFQILQDSKLVEIKQGYYSGHDADKDVLVV
jgi:hypothetical protein